MDIEGIRKLNDWVQESDNVVFFGGAGVSTESGIPDSAVWTVCITRNGSIRPSRFSATAFLRRTLRSTTVSTGKSW